MAKKGREKNTKNKTLHTKLMDHLKNKKKVGKEATKQRIKEIQKKFNEEQKLND